MKLLSIQQTTLLRLGVLSRPEGQIYIPEAITGIKETFHFVKAPEFPSEKPGTLEFSQGKFKNFAIESLGLYNDGIVIKSATDSRRLDELMVFIEQWAHKHFDITFFSSTSAGTIYESNLIVQFDAKIMSKVFRKFAVIEKGLGGRIFADSNLTATFSLGGISCSVESRQIENFKPTLFRLEHKAGSEVGLGQFFSVAPLRTQSHLEVLEEFEALA